MNQDDKPFLKPVKENSNIRSRNWQPTANRFIGFFDIMGFKDRVYRQKHEDVYNDLSALHEWKRLSIDGILPEEFKIGDQTYTNVYIDTKVRTALFSDTVLLISESDDADSAFSLMFHSNALLRYCIKNKIPIKGAIAFGNFSANLEQSVFFGQPLIDAYELHNELEMYSAILHSSAEKKLSQMNVPDINRQFINYKTPTKSGRINYDCLSWPLISVTEMPLSGKGKTKFSDLHLSAVKEFYQTTSGKARIYIDNTVEFIKWLMEQEKIRRPEIFSKQEIPE